MLQYSVKFVNVSTAGKQNLASGVELGGWIPPPPKKRNKQTIIIVENICGPGNIYTHPKEGHLTIRQSRGGGGGLNGKFLKDRIMKPNQNFQRKLGNEKLLSETLALFFLEPFITTLCIFKFSHKIKLRKQGP